LHIAATGAPESVLATISLTVMPVAMKSIMGHQ